MDEIVRDIRYAFRSLLRSRGFAAAAIVALGLGTGAATAVFSLLDGVVLRPLPYREPEQLVMRWETNREQGLTRERLSPVNVMDYRDLDGSFECGNRDSAVIRPRSAEPCASTVSSTPSWESCRPVSISRMQPTSGNGCAGTCGDTAAAHISRKPWHGCNRARRQTLRSDG